MGVSGQRQARAALYPRGKDLRYPFDMSVRRLVSFDKTIIYLYYPIFTYYILQSCLISFDTLKKVGRTTAIQIRNQWLVFLLAVLNYQVLITD
jgi:hypothetical protein